MSVIHIPDSCSKLTDELESLHDERREYPKPARRLSLNREARRTVFGKTAGRCHLCGGEIAEEAFAADHVLSLAVGGPHDINNYLPAHGLCNRSRWFYSPKEFQWILRMGVWARKQIEGRKGKRTKFGATMCEAFVQYEKRARKPRKPVGGRPPNPSVLQKSADRQ